MYIPKYIKKSAQFVCMTVCLYEKLKKDAMNLSGGVGVHRSGWREEREWGSLCNYILVKTIKSKLYFQNERYSKLLQ